MTQNNTKVEVELYSFEYKEWLRTSKNSSSSSGYVYLIHAIGTNRYKIGRTNNLHVRLKQLQSQNPYPLKIKAAFKTSNPAWESLESDDPQKYKYFDRASYYLEVDTYDSTAYLEV